MEIFEKYLNKSPKTASRIIEGEAVVVLPETSDVNILNYVASRIWDLADGRKKTNEIILTIQNEYEAEDEEIKNDSVEIINMLITKNMLIVAD